DRFTIARLNDQLGDRAKAISWYESLLDGFDFAWAAPAHRALASIHAAAGDSTRARAHDTAFRRLTAK
ncbi:MAG: hypothetical protein WEE89_09750, partial [Gemmatimonadota bacterium]